MKSQVECRNKQVIAIIPQIGFQAFRILVKPVWNTDTLRLLYLLKTPYMF